MILYSQLLVCFSRSDAIFLYDQAWSVVQITHSTHALYKLGTVGSTSNIFKTNKTNNNSQALFLFISEQYKFVLKWTGHHTFGTHKSFYLFIYFFFSFISWFFFLLLVCFFAFVWENGVPQPKETTDKHT